MTDIWQNLTNGSFKGIPFHVAIPNRSQQFGVESEEYSVERRLQFIKRPLIDGAPVRDWGADPQSYSATIEFFGINHARDSKKFLDALDQGTPGTLILPTIPKAVLAYFWKRTRSTAVHEGNSVRLTVTWVDANEIKTAGTGRASAFDVQPPTIDQAASAALTNASNALSVLQNNPLLTAVRTFEAGISQVRSAVNFVVTLEEGVRNRINSIRAEITGTISQISGAIAEIQSVFSPTSPKTSAVNTPGTLLGTDSETGQAVISVSEPDVLPLAPDPLAPPDLTPTIPIPKDNFGTLPGVSNFGAAAAAFLSADRDELNAISQGRTEDISRAVTSLINSLNAYITVVLGEPPGEYVVPMDMSLGEAMFFNGIDMSLLNDIRKANPQVLDPFLVPRGTILTMTTSTNIPSAKPAQKSFLRIEDGGFLITDDGQRIVL